MFLRKYRRAKKQIKYKSSALTVEPKLVVENSRLKGFFLIKNSSPQSTQEQPAQLYYCIVHTCYKIGDTQCRTIGRHWTSIDSKASSCYCTVHTCKCPCMTNCIARRFTSTDAICRPFSSTDTICKPFTSTNIICRPFTSTDAIWRRCTPFDSVESFCYCIVHMCRKSNDAARSSNRNTCADDCQGWWNEPGQRHSALCIR